MTKNTRFSSRYDAALNRSTFLALGEALQKAHRLEASLPERLTQLIARLDQDNNQEACACSDD
jgi:hypothetical protein